MNDVIEFHLAPKLDTKTLVSFAMTSTIWRETLDPEIQRRHLKRRRLERRRQEIIRCARIYKYLPVPEEQFPNNILTAYPGCSAHESSIIRRVLWDCWFRAPPRLEYESCDPDSWYHLTDDMRMGAPHDAALIYNFYIKVIKDRGSL